MKLTMPLITGIHVYLKYKRLWFVLINLLYFGFMLTQPVVAMPEQGIQETVVDVAVISSPQTTLKSLLHLTDSFHELVREDGFTRENMGRVNNILQQLNKLSDLREVPQRYRRNVSAETAVYLREALARSPMPAMEKVPDEDRMAVLVKEGKTALYRLPGTPLVIRKIDTGIYGGRYQFSPATVAEAKGWYDVVKEYPYVQGQEYIAGLYDNYFLTPGPLIPVDLVRALPDWMQDHYLEQTVWQWLLLFVTVVVLAGVLLLLNKLFKHFAIGKTRMQQNLLSMLWPISMIYLTLGARSFLEKEIFITGDILQHVLLIAKLMILAAAVSLIIRLGGVVTEALLVARQFNTRQIDQQLVRLGGRMLSILISIIVVMEGMQKIGFSLATLVAGAGVTGLAIALAAQDTLKNVFGGLLLAMDRPFEVGQRVRIKGYEGHIKQVGLRSIRLRTLKGNEIIIPNDEVARIEIENIGRRPYIRRDLNITITYDTPLEKIDRAVEILREILAVPEKPSSEAIPADEVNEPHPNEAINQPDHPPLVYFNNLNADSLNLLVVYWFHPPEQWQGVAFDHRINRQIMERFNAEGIEFAFPSQTMYLAGDNNRPLNLNQTPLPSQAVATRAAKSVSTQGSSPGSAVTAKTEKRSDADIEQELLHGKDGDNGDVDGS
jgi:MscS family membrane protein